MLYKLIFVLATLCVVNASVISADVFDDDSETGVADARSCHPLVCNLMCRRLLFPSGKCVGDRCECNRALNAEDDLETEFAMKPSRCYPKACNAVCHIFKRTNGTCVEGRCTCAKKNNAEGEAPEQLLSDLEESVLQEVSELSEDQIERKCIPRACEEFCRRIKKPVGVCVNGRCKCDNFRTEDAVDEYSELDRSRGCKLRRCNRSCVKRGYESGTCVNGVCECAKETPEVLEDSLPLSELSEDQIERKCNLRACEQLCRRLRFRGGACVNGRCKCDNFFATEDAVDEYSEDQTRGCKWRRCNRSCIKRGYESGSLVNGVCQCNKKTSEDLPLLDDVTNDVQEDSNNFEDNIEEEIVPRACSPMACNQACRGQNRPGGWCISGICSCF